MCSGAFAGGAHWRVWRIIVSICSAFDVVLRWAELALSPFAGSQRPSPRRGLVRILAHRAVCVSVWRACDASPRRGRREQWCGACLCADDRIIGHKLTWKLCDTSHKRALASAKPPESLRKSCRQRPCKWRPLFSPFSGQCRPTFDFGTWPYDARRAEAT